MPRRIDRYADPRTSYAILRDEIVSDLRAALRRTEHGDGYGSTPHNNTARQLRSTARKLDRLADLSVQAAAFNARKRAEARFFAADDYANEVLKDVKLPD